MDDQQKALASELHDRMNRMEAIRQPWETTWQDIRLLARPETNDFKGERLPGLTRSDYIYDDSPLQALDTLVNGLDSNLTSSFQRWFAYQTTDRVANSNPAILAYLDQTSDSIYNKINQPEAMFPLSNVEMFSELCAFGTGPIYLDRDYAGKLMRFRSYPLANCYIEENCDGLVDVVFRRFKFTTRQCWQKFKNDELPEKIIKSKELNAEWELVHAVFPRTDRDPFDPRAKNMAFASVIMVKDDPHIIRESGFKQFPWLVPRWKKLSGSPYGYGPFHNCIQNVRMLNALERVYIQGASLAAMPPVMMENEDWGVPFEWRPGFVIYGDPGSQMPKPVLNGGQPEQAEKLMEYLRQQIKNALYNGLFEAQNYGNRDRVTATEVQNEQEMKMRGIGPMLGRLILEYLSPMHHQLLRFYTEVGVIKPPPVQMRGHRADIMYLSPAARAQRQVKSANMKNLLSGVIPLMQYAPNLADGLKLPKYLQQLAISAEVDREIIASDAEIKKIQDDRAAQQQQAQYAKMAESVGGALKDTATAASMAPGMVGQ